MRVPRTFVFVDLSGFTNYTGAFGDDAAGRLLSAFRTIVRQVASERGVRIAKWLGDGCMIVAIDQPEAIALTLDLRDRSADAGDADERFQISDDRVRIDCVDDATFNRAQRHTPSLPGRS